MTQLARNAVARISKRKEVLVRSHKINLSRSGASPRLNHARTDCAGSPTLLAHRILEKEQCGPKRQWYPPLIRRSLGMIPLHSMWNQVESIHFPNLIAKLDRIHQFRNRKPVFPYEARGVQWRLVAKTCFFPQVTECLKRQLTLERLPNRNRRGRQSVKCALFGPNMRKDMTHRDHSDHRNIRRCMRDPSRARVSNGGCFRSDMEE